MDEKIIGSLVVLRISGDFQPEDVSELHHVFQNAVSQNKRIVIEFAFTKTPNYCILKPLIKLAGTLSVMGKKLMLAKASGNLRFLLTMLKKQEWFEFHETINDLVLEESEKQSAAENSRIDEDTQNFQPVYYEVPNVTDFKEL